ncbi:rhomboid family intramembrane serine protease [Fluviicola taffensis]|uniref:Rhomboid family protein n=1 Tax=Fluviicola taffensis (strain DSM 16823 / NCIMB 13979 / RW262) TaxID=755732 RepID=F2ICJ0_FLUTR|nr:rhomboid family intramembrane serine protease [Fluviicola taffensis]AEA45460.1 Rhomboid family protein [Fluviicola taffensis DSM 16823]
MEPQIYSTYILLGIMIVMSLTAFNNRDFMEKYLFSPYLVKHERESYRFITHAFLHGDFGHLLFNGITVFFFGTAFESKLIEFYGLRIGEVVFWGFVIISMFASSSVSYFRHKDNPNYRSLGLSGVASAILFAMIMLEPEMKIGFMFIPVPIPAWVFGPIYLAFEIYSDRNRKTNIAHDAHISGAIFGIIFILITNIEQVISAFQNLLQ